MPQPLSAFVFIITLVTTMLVAPLRTAEAQLYEIDSGQFTQGCLPPCLCPILLLGELEGTFALNFSGTDASFSIYELLDVDAIAINLAGDVLELGGSGEYRVDEIAGEHEMLLDVVDLATGESFAMTSGGVVSFTPGVSFPDIEILVGTSLSCSGTHISLSASPTAQTQFIRGDCNADGAFDISDAGGALTLLFIGGATSCATACDANDDGTFDISDAIYSLAALFTSGSPPAAPYPDCGVDPTPDSLACTAFTVCP